MDQLQIIGLNYGDTKATIHKYITKHQINWPQAFANESLLKQLRIDGFPNYMLIDKNGNVLLMNASIEEIQAQLQRF